jgi:LPS sulfotransferase NodH
VKYKFIIFAHARSGSGTLSEIFASQGVNILIEPFNTIRRDKTYIEQLKTDTIECVMSKLWKNCNAFKHLSYQLEESKNNILLNNHKIIFLQRENLLDAAISLYIAFINRIWTTKEANKNYILDPIEINVDSLKGSIEIFEKHKSYKKECVDFYDINYEKIYKSKGEDQKKIIYDLFDFVGVEIKDYNEIAKLLDVKNKINKREWHEVIKNWDEIKSCFYL